jgi:FtsH-binding integral membrane protein
MTKDRDTVLGWNTPSWSDTEPHPAHPELELEPMQAGYPLGGAYPEYAPAPQPAPWIAAQHPAPPHSSSNAIPYRIAPAPAHGAGPSPSVIPPTFAPSSPHAAPPSAVPTPYDGAYDGGPYGAPSYMAPTPHVSPSYGAPSYGAPSYGAPSYGASSYEPSHGTRSYGASSYEPSHGAPSYGASPYEPSHGAPSYGAPSYEPSHGAPSYGASAYEPSYGAPSYSATHASPSYSAPHASPSGGRAYGAPSPGAPASQAAPYGALPAAFGAFAYSRSGVASAPATSQRAIRKEATGGVSDRARFIRLTYLHLLLAILAFGGLMYLLMTQELLVTRVSAPLVAFALGGRAHWAIVLVAFMAVSWVADHWASSASSRAMQYAGLAFYVVAEALIFVPLLAIVEWKTRAILAQGGTEPHIVRDAAIVTLGLFTALTASVWLSRKDFSFLRSGLAIASGAALSLIAVSLVFGFSFGLVFSVAMVLLAGAYILYQTSQVLAHYDPRQHVAAALALFSSVALMFWYVIRILLRARD